MQCWRENTSLSAWGAARPRMHLDTAAWSQAGITSGQRLPTREDAEGQRCRPAGAGGGWCWKAGGGAAGLQEVPMKLGTEGSRWPQGRPKPCAKGLGKEGCEVGVQGLALGE